MKTRAGAFGTAALVGALTMALPATAGARGEGDRKRDEVSAATIAARQKIFGAENVDGRTGEVRKDRVIFSWITNASFAASVKGRVVLLDTFVTRLETTPGRTPFVIQDLVDLMPEALFSVTATSITPTTRRTSRTSPARRSTPRPRPARTCSSTPRRSSVSARPYRAST